MAAYLNIKRKVLDTVVVSEDETRVFVQNITEPTGCSTLFYEVGVDIPPDDQTFNSGKSEVTLLTFPAKAGITGGDYFVVFDSAGNGWAAAMNVSGSDPAPVGAVYTGIAAGRKVNVNISSATTAAQVAALVETAFDALTSNPFNTDDSAANGTMLVTCLIRGNTTNAQVHNANDSGAGSLTAVVQTAGVASDVNTTSNNITVSSHGYATGQVVQVSSTGTLPSPLVAATDYYVIKVDNNTIQLATTLQNAEDGTEIDLTTQGSDGGIVTLDVEQLVSGSLQLQKSLGGDSLDPDDWAWFNEGSPVAVTADGFYSLEKSNPGAVYYAVLVNLDEGQMVLSGQFLGKGIGN